MTSFHVPDLDKLEKLLDRETRFYAIVGALMSLNGALEVLEFQVFQKGTGLPEEMAAAVFYPVRNDAARTAMAVGAMKIRVQGNALLQPAWASLETRLKNAEVKASRNLVAHNPAIREVREVNTGLLLALWGQTTDHIVRLDPLRACLENKDASADFSRLRKACESLLLVLSDLDDFLAALA